MAFIKRQVLLAAAMTTAVHAFQSISVPASITAGQDFSLTVTTNSTDSTYTSYRVYLDTTPPGYKGGPSCYLQNTTATSEKTLTLNIPADFGPDGDYYSISTKEFPDATGYTISNTFNLSGATGNWSTYENDLKGSPLWPADDLPCTAYACARKCAMDSYPEDETYGSAAYNSMTSCIKACPQVSVPKSTSSASGTAAATATSGSSSGSATSGAAAATTTGANGIAIAMSTGAASANSASVALLAAAGLFALHM